MAETAVGTVAEAHMARRLLVEVGITGNLLNVVWPVVV
jgi:hypothetical protein